MPHGFRRGEHICSIHDTEEEQLATAAAYLADGIWQGQRCLYIAADRGALQRFRTALGAHRLDAAILSERGALIELTHDDAYLAGGEFSVGRLVTLLTDSIEQATADGFAGWRGCGDMSWLLAAAPGSERVAEYEALLQRFFADRRASGMCQYDRERLPLPLIDMALATHSTAVIGGRQRFNPFFQGDVS